MVSWPDLTFPPLNLWNSPLQPNRYGYIMSKHPLSNVFYVYEENKKVLGQVLKNAGGDPNLIFQLPEWQQVMYVLASNKIILNAINYKEL